MNNEEGCHVFEELFEICKNQGYVLCHCLGCCEHFPKNKKVKELVLERLKMELLEVFNDVTINYNCGTLSLFKEEPKHRATLFFNLVDDTQCECELIIDAVFLEQPCKSFAELIGLLCDKCEFEKNESVSIKPAKR